MAIRIFVTGGTVDKTYNELDGSLFFRDSSINELLAHGRNRATVSVTTIMLVDSLDMQVADRDLVAGYCAAATEDKIIITHGTDTMTETARVIAARNLRKTIVLTGAMIPHKLGNSDGSFNIGCAIAFVQLLRPGVYIVMNGRYFHWDNVQKNRGTGEFQVSVAR